MRSLRWVHRPHPRTRTTWQERLARHLLPLLFALAGSGILAPESGFAIQNQASGSASGTPLELSLATVTLNRVPLNAVTAALAEISPSKVSACRVGMTFSYHILPTITAADAGIGSLSITAPEGFTKFAATQLQVGGVLLRANCPSPGAGEYCAAGSNRTIKVTLGSKVTTDQTRVGVLLSADTPLAPCTGDFTSLLGSSPPFQATTPGDADGNPKNSNSWSVETVALDLKNSTLSANPPMVIADGNAASTLSATVLNGSNQPLPGIPISLASQRGALDSLKQPAGPTDKNGLASGEIRSTQVGVTTVSAATSNGSTLPVTVQVFFTQGQVLELSKSASKKEASVGDVVTYQVLLRNKTTKIVQQVRVEDQIPPNFKYVKGSTRLNGQAAPDPAGNRTLSFEIGSIPALLDLNGNGRADPGEVGYFSLSYQLVIGSGATPNSYLNTAVAKDVCPSCVISNTDQARVSVTLDPLFDLGTIIGKVFLDKNENGYQDPDEPGIGQVMVALDNGSYALTDEYGRYHFPAVTPGQRLLKINLNSLPPGTTLTTRETQVVAVTPGLLAKANFGVQYHVDTESIGRPGRQGSRPEGGLLLASQASRKPLEVIGNVEEPAVLINGDQAKLPKSDIRMVPDNPDQVIDIKLGPHTDPAEFSTELSSRDRVLSWKMSITDSLAQEIHALQGTGPPPEVLSWDGKKSDGSLVEGGKICQYQLFLSYADGSSSSTPRRSFGVRVSSAISLNLMGGAFRSGSDQLTSRARPILLETALVLRRFTQEKIIIEGHTDGVGSEAYNLELSRRRAQAAFNYFVEVEKIPRARFIVNWYGKSRPIATNAFEEGRELNRRVVIKGEFSDNQEAQAVDPYRGTPAAKVNGSAQELDRHGRFATTVADVKRDNVEIDLTGTQGGNIHALLPVPNLEILAPQGELRLAPGGKGGECRIIPPTAGGERGGGAAQQASPAPDPGSAEAARQGVLVACGLRGSTEPGNSVELDGVLLKSSPEGSFAADLGLGMGDNHYSLLVRNKEGFTRIANLLVRISGSDPEGVFVVTLDPIPNLTLKLPPKGVKLTTPKLTFSGSTDPGNSIQVNGKKLPVGSDGRFTASLPLAKGMNRLRVQVSDPQGHTGLIEREYEFSDTNLFFLAFGDSTISQIRGKGYLQGAGMDQPSQFQEQGRIAYYLKGVIAGKYLITSAFDTGTRNLGTLFKDLDKTENDRLLTNLDPDKIYPVYGDASTVVYDAQSQGKLYLALDSDELHLLLGNYPLNLSDTELAAYQRTLYGGRLGYQSKEKTAYGQPQTKLDLFGAELHQAHVSDELAATGTSLYYLSHQNLVEGSEQVSLVVRDKNTALQLSTQSQQLGLDYTVKYDQGRVLFSRPVSSVAQSSTLISQDLLAGNPVYIRVEYETQLDSFEKSALGGHIRKQFGDHLAVGGTYIKDELQGGKYALGGADTEIRLAKGTRLVAEFAQSSGTDSLAYVSGDGGLSYQESAPGGSKKGSAWKLGAEVDVGEWFLAPDRTLLSGYYKRLESGFRSNGTLQEEGSLKYGAQGRFNLTDRDKILVRFDRDEQDGGSLLGPQHSSIADLSYQHDQGRWQASAEIQGRDGSQVGAAPLGSAPLAPAGAGSAGGLSVYAAARLRLEIVKALSVTAEEQQTLVGTANNQTRLGAEYQVNPALALQASGALGSQGGAGLAGAVVTLDNSKVFLKERLADDQAGKSSSTVVGGEKPIGAASKLYSEYQWEHASTGSRTISLLGTQTQWDLQPGLQLTASGEHGGIAAQTGNSERYSIAAGVNLNRPERLKFSCRAESRWESGSQKLLQYLTSNQLELKLNPDFTLVGKYRYSVSEDLHLDQVVAMFEEESLGVAFRPVRHDRFNALARFTRLVDQRGVAVDANLASKTISDVLSGEWSLQLGKKLEWVEKTAYKVSTEEYPDSPPFTGHTLLSLNRLNYHLLSQVDAALEYRVLWQLEARDQRQGWLTELDWEPVSHLRLGVGFNFTDFSDNEFAENNYSTYGWFLRVQGKY